MQQLNVVPEGPLGGFVVRAAVTTSCQQVDINPVTVAQIDHLTMPPMGTEEWFSTDLYQPSTIARQQRTLLAPLEISITPRKPLPLFVDNYGRRGAAKVVESVSVKLTLQDAKGDVTTVKRDRMTLHFANAVLPMLQQALRQPLDRTRSAVGIIDAGENRATTKSMYMQWDTSTEGTILAGVALNLWHEDGARWRLVQTSRDADQTVWALDFMSFYIDHAELAGPLPQCELGLSLTSATGEKIALATSVEPVLASDCTPFDNASVIRAVNLSAPVVEFSALTTAEGNRGWILSLKGSINGRPFESQLDQATASLFGDFKMQPPKVPFVVATLDGGAVEWWGEKTSLSSTETFLVVWVLVKKF